MKCGDMTLAQMREMVEKNALRLAELGNWSERQKVTAVKQMLSRLPDSRPLKKFYSHFNRLKKVTEAELELINNQQWHKLKL